MTTTATAIAQAIITRYTDPKHPDPGDVAPVVEPIAARPSGPTITARCASLPEGITIDVYATDAPPLRQGAPWRYSEHLRAARALMDRMGWIGHLVAGGLHSRDRDSYVFVRRADEYADDNRPGVACAYHREDCPIPGCRRDHRDPPRPEREPFLVGSTAGQDN